MGDPREKRPQTNRARRRDRDDRAREWLRAQLRDVITQAAELLPPERHSSGTRARWALNELVDRALFGGDEDERLIDMIGPGDGD